MPVISMFYGFVVALFYEDRGQHHRPHIHVRYQGTKAAVAIDTGEVLAGDFPCASSNSCRLGLNCTARS